MLENHRDDFAVCCAFLIRDRLRINVHRGPDVGTPQQLLRHLDIGSGAGQHGRVGVTERVPADLANARHESLPASVVAVRSFSVHSSGVRFFVAAFAISPSQTCNRRAKNLLVWPLCEVGMPQFVIEREIPGAGKLSDAELQAVARKSVGVLKDMGPEIKWLHSYVTGDKVYCVYLAPDEETVREHARRGGFPANRISAVRRMIDPNTAN
jgi:hypothetical protein